MTTTYDMTPLDAQERIPVKIHIINSKLSINELQTISIASDYNVAELKFEIESALSVEQQHQIKLTLQLSPTNDNEEKETHIELTSDDMKLSEYNITKNTIIELQLSDDSNWNVKPIKMDTTNSKRPLKMDAVNTRPGGTVQSMPVQTSTRETDQIIHFLTKHSKIQCRVLLIVFEITLVLLVAYWGTVSMIQYCINMVFVLVAWRGCRKLKPFFIICFLLYMVLDIIIIFLLIILGIVEQHESVYGSTAAYIILLCIELLLNITWFYFYAKFFYAVLKASETVRQRARTITSKQPILI